MARKKGLLFVTGANGLLGSKIASTAKNTFEVSVTDISELSNSFGVRMDISDQSQVSSILSRIRPDVVVHTASETNVDKCEIKKEHAWKVNVNGTRNLAIHSAEIGAKFVYISTDYVFDGEKGCYAEEDYPNPVSHYGLTKLEGEKQVMKFCKDFAILRTSVLYGRHPCKQDFSSWVINKLMQNQEIAVVNDHINTPTLVDNLADMTLEVVERDLQGLYHSSGSERISRFEFARRIAKTFDLNSDLVKPIKMEELKVWIAKRPRDSSLKTEKIQKQLNAKPLNIKQGLTRLKAEMGA